MKETNFSVSFGSVEKKGKYSFVIRFPDVFHGCLLLSQINCKRTFEEKVVTKLSELSARKNPRSNVWCTRVHIISFIRVILKTYFSLLLCTLHWIFTSLLYCAILMSTIFFLFSTSSLSHVPRLFAAEFMHASSKHFCCSLNKFSICHEMFFAFLSSFF